MGSVALGFVIKSSPLIACLDAHFPVHGNWKGPSVDKLVCAWLMYIISENDHRLSPMQDWAARHLNTLRVILEYPELTALDFQDDRLGNLLEQFGQDKKYLPFHADYTGRLLRLFGLEQSTVRYVFRGRRTALKTELIGSGGHPCGRPGHARQI